MQPRWRGTPCCSISISGRRDMSGPHRGMEKSWGILQVAIMVSSRELTVREVMILEGASSGQRSSKSSSFSILKMLRFLYLEKVSQSLCTMMLLQPYLVGVSFSKSWIVPTPYEKAKPFLKAIKARISMSFFPFRSSSYSENCGKDVTEDCAGKLKSQHYARKSTLQSLTLPSQPGLSS